MEHYMMILVKSAAKKKILLGIDPNFTGND